MLRSSLAVTGLLCAAASGHSSELCCRANKGSRLAAMKQNETARKKTVSYIEGKRNQIAKLQAEITDLEAAGEAISMYSISAFSGGEDAGVDI